MPNPADPQSLNRYSYVLNNPLKFVDPSGHLAQGEDDTGDVGLTLELLTLRWPQDFYPNRGRWSRFLDQMVERAGQAVDLLDLIEGARSLAHGGELARGGFALGEGGMYAGQVLVYGSRATKALAGLSPYLTHARGSTHAGLRPYTNPLAAARNAVWNTGTALTLAAIYAIDIYEYRDDGTKLASALVVDTGITLGPPAAGAALGAVLFPGPGAVVGAGAGYLVSAALSLFAKESAVNFVDRHIVTPLVETYSEEPFTDPAFRYYYRTITCFSEICYGP